MEAAGLLLVLLLAVLPGVFSLEKSASPHLGAVLCTGHDIGDLLQLSGTTTGTPGTNGTATTGMQQLQNATLQYLVNASEVVVEGTVVLGPGELLNPCTDLAAIDTSMPLGTVIDVEVTGHYQGNLTFSPVDSQLAGGSLLRIAVNTTGQCADDVVPGSSLIILMEAADRRDGCGWLYHMGTAGGAVKPSSAARKQLEEAGLVLSRGFSVDPLTRRVRVYQNQQVPAPVPAEENPQGEVVEVDLEAIQGLIDAAPSPDNVLRNDQEVGATLKRPEPPKAFAIVFIVLAVVVVCAAAFIRYTQVMRARRARQARLDAEEVSFQAEMAVAMAMASSAAPNPDDPQAELDRELLSAIEEVEYIEGARSPLGGNGDIRAEEAAPGNLPAGDRLDRPEAEAQRDLRNLSFQSFSMKFVKLKLAGNWGSGTSQPSTLQGEGGKESQEAGEGTGPANLRHTEAVLSDGNIGGASGHGASSEGAVEIQDGKPPGAIAQIPADAAAATAGVPWTGAQASSPELQGNAVAATAKLTAGTVARQHRAVHVQQGDGDSSLPQNGGHQQGQYGRGGGPALISLQGAEQSARRQQEAQTNHLPGGRDQGGSGMMPQMIHVALPVSGSNDRPSHQAWRGGGNAAHPWQAQSTPHQQVTDSGGQLPAAWPESHPPLERWSSRGSSDLSTQEPGEQEGFADAPRMLCAGFGSLTDLTGHRLQTPPNAHSAGLVRYMAGQPGNSSRRPLNVGAMQLSSPAVCDTLEDHRAEPGLHLSRQQSTRSVLAAVKKLLTRRNSRQSVSSRWSAPSTPTGQRTPGNSEPAAALQGGGHSTPPTPSNRRRGKSCEEMMREANPFLPSWHEIEEGNPEEPDATAATTSDETPQPLSLPSPVRADDGSVLRPDFSVSPSMGAVMSLAGTDLSRMAHWQPESSWLEAAGPSGFMPAPAYSPATPNYSALPPQATPGKTTGLTSESWGVKLQEIEAGACNNGGHVGRSLERVRSMQQQLQFPPPAGHAGLHILNHAQRNMLPPYRLTPPQQELPHGHGGHHLERVISLQQQQLQLPLSPADPSGLHGPGQAQPTMLVPMPHQPHSHVARNLEKVMSIQQTKQLLFSPAGQPSLQSPGQAQGNMHPAQKPHGHGGHNLERVRSMKQQLQQPGLPMHWWQQQQQQMYWQQQQLLQQPAINTTSGSTASQTGSAKLPSKVQFRQGNTRGASPNDIISNQVRAVSLQQPQSQMMMMMMMMMQEQQQQQKRSNYPSSVASTSSSTPVLQPTSGADAATSCQWSPHATAGLQGTTWRPPHQQQLPGSEQRLTLQSHSSVLQPAPTTAQCLPAEPSSDLRSKKVVCKAAPKPRKYGKQHNQEKPQEITEEEAKQKLQLQMQQLWPQMQRQMLQAIQPSTAVDTTSHHPQGEPSAALAHAGLAPEAQLPLTSNGVQSNPGGHMQEPVASAGADSKGSPPALDTTSAMTPAAGTSALADWRTSRTNAELQLSPTGNSAPPTPLQPPPFVPCAAVQHQSHPETGLAGQLLQPVEVQEWDPTGLGKSPEVKEQPLNTSPMPRQMSDMPLAVLHDPPPAEDPTPTAVLWTKEGHQASAVAAASSAAMCVGVSMAPQSDSGLLQAPKEEVGGAASTEVSHSNPKQDLSSMYQQMLMMQQVLQAQEKALADDVCSSQNAGLSRASRVGSQKSGAKARGENTVAGKRQQSEQQRLMAQQQATAQQQLQLLGQQMATCDPGFTTPGSTSSAPLTGQHPRFWHTTVLPHDSGLPIVIVEDHNGQRRRRPSAPEEIDCLSASPLDWLKYPSAWATGRSPQSQHGSNPPPSLAFPDMPPVPTGQQQPQQTSGSIAASGHGGLRNTPLKPPSTPTDPPTKQPSAPARPGLPSTLTGQAGPDSSPVPQLPASSHPEAEALMAPFVDDPLVAYNHQLFLQHMETAQSPSSSARGTPASSPPRIWRGSPVVSAKEPAPAHPEAPSMTMEEQQVMMQQMQTMQRHWERLQKNTVAANSKGNRA